MKIIKWSIIFIVIALISACKAGPESPKGFSLPVGDIKTGESVFTQHQCIACHTIAGIADSAQERSISVELGGKVTKVKTYADLVTSIINPSHKLASGYPQEIIANEGKSKMPNYNDVMTVSELIDVVTFLQSKYKLKQTPITVYPYY